MLDMDQLVLRLEVLELDLVVVLAAVRITEARADAHTSHSIGLVASVR